MARLELRNASKSYGKTVAVKDIDLVVEDNEFFCIFGPPSSGKTTILRLLLGLVAPDEGEIVIGDMPVVDQGPKERNLAMVFQNLALFPHMSAGQNLAFPLVERKMEKAAIMARVAEVAEDASHHAAAGQAAGAPERRRASARGHRPGAGAGPCGLPDGRADRGARCQAARGDAGRAQAAAA